MTTCFLAPDPLQSTFLIPGGNTPGNGAQLFTYLAGSTTKQTVYKDNAAATPWSNPIVMDSGGNLPNGGVIWIPTGVTIKAVYAPSNDTDPPGSPYRTIDNIAGINDVTTSGSDWQAGPTPTFVGATQFTLAGDQRAIFTNGRRIKSTNTGGTIYSTITNVGFAASLTTVNVANDSGSLDSGMSAVFYALIDPSLSSIDWYSVQRKGTAVASAGNGTTDIWGTNGDYIHITGTNTINCFSTSPYAGAKRTIQFDGILSLNSSASITLPYNQNITTAAGNLAEFVADTVSSVVLLAYRPASGNPLFGAQNSGTVFAGSSSGASSVPTFRALVGAESALQLIQSTTVVSSVTADFLNISSTGPYDSYEVHCMNVVPTAGPNSLQLQLSSDGGTTWISSSIYRNACMAIDGTFSAGSTVIFNTGTLTQFTLISAQMANAAGQEATAKIRIYRVNDLGHKNMEYTAVWGTGASEANYAWGGCVCNTTGVIANGIRIKTNTGSISTGTFYLYGIRNS